jgi:hypothetical protein
MRAGQLFPHSWGWTGTFGDNSDLSRWPPGPLSHCQTIPLEAGEARSMASSFWLIWGKWGISTLMSVWTPAGWTLSDQKRKRVSCHLHSVPRPPLLGHTFCDHPFFLPFQELEVPPWTKGRSVLTLLCCRFWGDRPHQKEIQAALRKNIS